MLGRIEESNQINQERGQQMTSAQKSIADCTRIILREF